MGAGAYIGAGLLEGLGKATQGYGENQLKHQQDLEIAKAKGQNPIEQVLAMIAQNMFGGMDANAPSSDVGAPQPGAVVDGYRFKGGNPSDQNNWEPI